MIEPPVSGNSGTTPRMKCVTLTKFSRTSESWPLAFTSRNGGVEAAAGVVHQHVDVVRTAPARRRGSRRPASPSRTSSSRGDDAATRRLDRVGGARRGSRRRGRRSRRSAPKRANAIAIASPIPTAAPVTTATRSVSSAADGSSGTAGAGYRPPRLTGMTYCTCTARRCWSPERRPGSAPHSPKGSRSEARSSASARDARTVCVTCSTACASIRPESRSWVVDLSRARRRRVVRPPRRRRAGRRSTCS